MTDELLTLPQALKLLQVPRSTFYGWLQRGVAPKTIKYPNGKIMVRRSDLEAWLATQEVSA
ncbi:helix-turn-helix transcriptional regulator [Nocardiopsis suaedae]|uniref:Helix-turn-helix domain-containing protein n=1 Tax=Nocardiopsis suaedae TaxID=3018444 RepID=A0ABT4TIR7_9ACTN|nr:helix-turn-helix domain-containing protein [Nocardiopsis suaedae]MDA2804577.1 helix-turn-helix domain-containing protein [Nocardiopsis suaedae]